MTVDQYEITLPDSYHEQDTPARGYLEDVQVRLRDGPSYKLTFLDSYNNENYRYYFEGQNIVLVEEVTSDNMHSAIRQLFERGAFSNMREAI
ncbi:hypothetical protein [Sorangium sp. So ce1000]|uniref:hypothetical protein n=1 Tax=Sorangium sp. So ce1000 TaxID=3133325 RepID=UPI003F5F0D36